ncbi:MAG: hypothetical protein ACLU8F_04580 [Clostridia bacterium]
MDKNDNQNNSSVNGEQEKMDRKVDNLINIVENHTRTERHLEQYSDIGDPEYKEQARNKQDLREKQMDELKNQLTGNEKNAPTKEEQMEDLKQNYEFGEGYIASNKDHMNEEDLRNLERRQENRKIQMENLGENIKNDD